MSRAPIDIVLAGLTRVRQRQPGQWSACCPAHKDRDPSLSVRQNTDGAVLMHCFGGCSVDAVLAALALDMASLFPPQERSGREPKRLPRLLSSGQAMELLQSESILVATAAHNIAHGVTLTPADRERLLLAAGRVGWLREQSRGRAHD